MSRLIDADRLMKTTSDDLKVVVMNLEAYVKLDDMIKWVDNQPTVNYSGWVPCSLGLKPEEDGLYLATLDGGLVGQEEPFVASNDLYKGKWSDEECMIAWQPLPEPFKKGAEDEKMNNAEQIIELLQDCNGDKAKYSLLADYFACPYEYGDEPCNYSQGVNCNECLGEWLAAPCE